MIFLFINSTGCGTSVIARFPRSDLASVTPVPACAWRDTQQPLRKNQVLFEGALTSLNFIITVQGILMIEGPCHDPGAFPINQGMATINYYGYSKNAREPD